MYSQEFTSEVSIDLKQRLEQASSDRVPNILKQAKVSFDDFLCLISPGAEKYLEDMARAARRLTLHRFGANIFLYAPLYVSNECVNTCTYCGFSRPNKILRRTLRLEEIESEAEVLRRTGIQQVLLLTGESPKKNPVPYLLDAVKILHKHFHSVSIEIYPVSGAEYLEFHQAGVEGVTLYQETYDRETYARIHPAGFKKDFNFRLDTVERAAEAGVRKLTIGALLGLAPWRLEMAALAHHLSYLERVAWRSALSLSFPRIREAAFYTHPDHIITDTEFVQIITAFRLFSPNSGINLSTRESADFRDALLPLGVTHLSAGSRTDIGGYSGTPDSTEQFSLEDQRSPAEVAARIIYRGYQPVFKEWDQIIAKTA